MVRDTTYQRLGDQKERASDTLGTVAGAVRGVTQQLRDGGQEQMADYANRAADGIERWSTQLRQQDVQDAIRGVQRFARREPLMFLGIAFGAGVLAARFLKSSSEDSQFSSRSGDSRWDTDGGGGSGAPAFTSGTLTTPAPSFGSTGSPTTVGGTPPSRTSGLDTPRLGSDVRPTREAL